MPKLFLNIFLKVPSQPVDKLFMRPSIDLSESNIEFQLSLLRLTAATAKAAKSVRAESWQENAENLAGLAEQVRVTQKASA